jgi:hypothetical protein
LAEPSKEQTPCGLRHAGQATELVPLSHTLGAAEARASLLELQDVTDNSQHEQLNTKIHAADLPERGRAKAEVVCGCAVTCRTLVSLLVTCLYRTAPSILNRVNSAEYSGVAYSIAPQYPDARTIWRECQA